MYYPLPLPKEFSIHTTSDGYCICGPHAQTVQGNIEGGTISSVYLIINNNKLCLVDTGRFSEIRECVATLIRNNQLTLEYIVLTHDHYDHVGNAESFQNEFGGEIIAHILDKPLIENPLVIFDDEKMKAAYGTPLSQAWSEMGLSDEKIEANKTTMRTYFNVPLYVNRYITEDTKILLGDLEIQLLHTPGHSPGSITVYVPKTKSIYTGDLTFWVNPCRPYPIGNAEDCVKSLEKIIALSPEYCGHGHYKGIDKPLDWLQSIVDLHSKLVEDILKYLSNPLTIQELRGLIYPEDPFDSFPAIPENSIQAYLVFLVQVQKVEKLSQGDKKSVLWKIKH